MTKEQDGLKGSWRVIVYGKKKKKEETKRLTETISFFEAVHQNQEN